MFKAVAGYRYYMGWTEADRYQPLRALMARMQAFHEIHRGRLEFEAALAGVKLK